MAVCFLVGPPQQTAEAGLEKKKRVNGWIISSEYKEQVEH